MGDAVAAQPRRSRALAVRGRAATRRPRRPRSIARTGANVSPVIQPAQISSHSACLSCRSDVDPVGELAEEVRAAAARASP